MTEGRCDFCGSSMDAVGGLFSAPRASICLGCAQTAIDALQGRAEVALTGVTSLQLPPGSVITTPLTAAVAAPTVAAAPAAAARRGDITISINSRSVAKLVVIGLVALLLTRRRR